jgi:D-alanine-D-alanine ligase
VARIDLRMAADGKVYVIEVNPLPGLTPEFSDLCTIARVNGIDFRTLIGEILAGCLKRHREARAVAPTEAATSKLPAPPPVEASAPRAPAAPAAPAVPGARAAGDGGGG